MHSSRKSLRSRLAPSLQGSLRASAKLFSGSGSSDIQFAGRDSDLKPVLSPLPEQHLSTPEPWSDDFEQISYDELRASLFLGDSSNFSSHTFDSQTSSDSSLLSRSRSTLSRLRKASRLSLTKPRGALHRKSANKSTQIQQSVSVPEETALIIAFPNPSSSTREGLRGRVLSQTAATPVDDSSSVFYDRDPFRRVESPIEDWSGKPQVPLQIVTEPDQVDSSVPARPLNQGVFSRKSLKRIKTFTHGALSSSSRKPPEVRQILPSESSSPQACLLADSSSLDTSFQPDNDFLPALSFDQLDFSSLFPKDKSWRFSVVSHRDRHSFCEVLQVSRPDVSDCIPHLQVVRYERVDPHDLTASPSPSTFTAYSPAVTPVSLHSPSWFSRNIKGLQVSEPGSPCLPIPPPASPPLPILPLSLLPVSSRSDNTQSWYESSEPPDTPCSTSSSVTLCSTSRRVSSSRSRPGSSNRLSIIHYRSSVVDSRKSVQSLVVYGSIAYSTAEGDQVLSDIQQLAKAPSLDVLLLSAEPRSTPQQSPLTPLALFDTEQPSHPLYSLPYPDSTRPRLQLAKQYYQFFIPSLRASQDFGRDRFPIPNYLLAIAKSALRDSQTFASMSHDMYGKPAETVDWGDEVDYSGYEWFKDPPPRPEPPPPSTTEAYVPQAGVIEQNEMFDFALKSAPNVLFARFKQYGQLGVLAWCSEFSEMIDALKTLGFQGNMFVSTRTQALDACTEILRLKLKIDMQIIVMYLSSQVARLRRFLDGERQWDDYPEPTFPLDYRQYQ